jgi:hypothetical protein
MAKPSSQRSGVVGGLAKRWSSGKIDLVLIGSYQRDLDFFYRCRVPENIQVGVKLF